eukprot:5272583-Prorocentrum_lima.AAC.1
MQGSIQHQRQIAATPTKGTTCMQAMVEAGRVKKGCNHHRGRKGMTGEGQGANEASKKGRPTS